MSTGVRRTRIQKCVDFEQAEIIFIVQYGANPQPMNNTAKVVVIVKYPTAAQKNSCKLHPTQVKIEQRNTNDSLYIPGKISTSKTNSLAGLKIRLLKTSVIS